MLEDIDPIVRIFGVGTALLGVSYGLFEQDIKRMLALSTISQLGFILAAPEVGGFYALTHGLVKSNLFLIGGNLPSRNLKELHHQPMSNSLWIALTIASFSISGFPLLSGFGAKILTMKNLMPWQVIAMNIAALGTASMYGKLIFLPHEKLEEGGKKPPIGFWLAIMMLISGLIGVNAFYYQAYTLGNIVKPLATIALGWLIYFLLLRQKIVRLPRMLEQFDHLIGMMSLMLLLLFWMVLP
jgi:multicomponent Na+:H+ antiporter subunit D